MRNNTPPIPAIFQQAIAKFQGMQDAFTDFGASLMNDTQFTDWLVAFNVDDMYEGYRPDGTQIEKTPLPREVSTKYEPSTIGEKKAKGQVYDRVTLKDTGAFYSGVHANVVGSQQIRIEDTDPKTDELIATWGLVLGVSQKNLAQFIEIIRPEFVKFANSYFD